MIINTIYDLCLQSINCNLQLQLIRITDDHHGNVFPIPSMKNPNKTRTLIIREPEPNT